MPKITISYRRADSQDITGRIFDRLVGHYGRDFVFRDIDSIRPGIDFREQISEALQTANVLLVIMGPRWLGRMKGSESRIDNDADFVRIEVETALGRKIPIVPVLVGGAAMPTTAQLPESLRDFAYRQAVAIDGGRDFDSHLNRLTRAIDDLLSMQAATRTEPARTAHPTAGAPIIVRPQPAPPPVAAVEAAHAPAPPPAMPPAQPPSAHVQPPPLPKAEPIANATERPPPIPSAPVVTIKLPTKASLKPAVDALAATFASAKAKVGSLKPADSLKPAIDSLKATIAALRVWPRPLWLGGGVAALVVVLIGAWIGLRKPDVPPPAPAVAIDKPAEVKKVAPAPAPSNLSSSGGAPVQ